MTVRVVDTLAGSVAASAGMKNGDLIHMINGSPVEDIIDFKFLSADTHLSIHYTDASGEHHISMASDDFDYGLIVEEHNFRVRQCANNCIFCFVAQQPSGLRETLRVRDDDYRLSFLAGNYITLTNLSAKDLNRIKRLRLSPLYISVHDTDPTARTSLLGNPSAGNILPLLTELSQAGIAMHLQIVLCPGINDDAHLERSLADLAALYPAVQSIAIVPAGTTAYQQNLDEALFTADWAARQANIVETAHSVNLLASGNGLVYAADELFLMSGMEIPAADYYEDFPQYENGIGFTREFIDDAEAVLSEVAVIPYNGRVELICGLAAAPVIASYIERLASITGIELQLRPVKNHFFGGRVNVSGLLAGSDICRALDDEPADGGLILLPENAVNGEMLLVDDMNVADIPKLTGRGRADIIRPSLSGLCSYLAEVTDNA